MKKLAQILGLAATLMFAQAAQATPVTQSTAPANADSLYYANGWNWQQLGSVTLASGTNTILGLTSTVTLKDQGWGGQDYNNGVLIGLFNDASTMLWHQRVAGANHSWTTQTFDITSAPASLNSLDLALDSIDWLNNSAVTLRMYTTPFAWGGWELHVQNASFSVTSDATSVPEPASIALLGLALAGMGFSRRKQA